ncbi:MAG: ABC transporter ATP-binding protein [Candidatus Bathyarchaeota archaeon]|nr:ABC transporter ATP-binding protein [Candidatus Bathyarchaeota archaeon]
MMANILEIKDLRIYYETKNGEVKAVDGVDMVIEKGTSVGLAGESGCGKTTLGLSFLKLLPTNGKIVSGSMIFDGEDIYAYDEKVFREDIRWAQISMIFQGAMNALNPVFKVEDQIAEAIKLHDKSKRKKERLEIARNLLRTVDIDPAMGSHYPHEFSGGMRQRAMIAMALACDPQLVIADEPTTALDVIVQKQLMDLLRRLKDEMNLSLVVISHDISVLAELCDYLNIMYAGRIVEWAEITEIFRNPQHHYTHGLISTFPTIEDEERLEKFIYIKGAPPNLLNPPSGCRFHPRCPAATDVCRQDPEPKMRLIGENHYVACHHPRGEEQ